MDNSTPPAAIAEHSLTGAELVNKANALVEKAALNYPHAEYVDAIMHLNEAYTLLRDRGLYEDWAQKSRFAYYLFKAYARMNARQRKLVKPCLPVPHLEGLLESDRNATYRSVAKAYVWFGSLGVRLHDRRRRNSRAEGAQHGTAVPVSAH